MTGSPVRAVGAVAAVAALVPSGVSVEVAVTGHVAPDSYRGMPVADGHPDVWLPIEVVVTALVP